jgi:thymidylate synthase
MLSKVGSVLSADEAWRQRVQEALAWGAVVAPRAQATRELLHHDGVTFDLARPVVASPQRKLNHRFMVAEALWILSGDDQLAPLTRFVKRMADFSDDGVRLAGAYGPRLVPQLPYVLERLLADRDTRQAVASIWTPNPRPSKDTPCTLALTFSVRDDRLFAQAFMRSSDIWLGVPYDMFSFAMVAVKVACLFNQVRGERPPVGLGQLTISATSSHLYERNVGEAQAVIGSSEAGGRSGPPLPEELVHAGRWDLLEACLLAVRDGPDEALDALPWRVRP